MSAAPNPATGVAKTAENFEMKAKEYEITKSVIRIVRSL